MTRGIELYPAEAETVVATSVGDELVDPELGRFAVDMLKLEGGSEMDVKAEGRVSVDEACVAASADTARRMGANRCSCIWRP